MRKYLNDAMELLAGELCNGLVRLRKGYVDHAEELMRIINSDRAYPFEFVVVKLTGYRPPSDEDAMQTIPGKVLVQDLQQLMFDVCDSFELKTSDYDTDVYDMVSLSRKYNVSTKTIQRWRRRGLPARRLIFADGKRKVGFLKESVDNYVQDNRQIVIRSGRFSQMTESEKDEIIRYARQIASKSETCLSDVAKKIANDMSRAVETVRYTIRKHDMQNPDEAIFSDLLAPLNTTEKQEIYRSFLRGMPVLSIAEKFKRTRGSIYRVVNEMRARQLLKREIGCIYHEDFDSPDADDLILNLKTETSSVGDDEHLSMKHHHGIPAYLRSLYEVPLLDAEGEQLLFKRYNYLKYKADKLRSRIDIDHVRTSQLKKVEGLLVRANSLKNRIIRANLRLVVSIAKKHLGGAQTLFELISDGNLSLMRAVEKFDYSRGYRFSTYASWAIMRNYARSVPREKGLLDRFSTGNEEVLDIAASLRSYDPNEMNLEEIRESIDVMLGYLSATERMILVEHYGLENEGQTRTLDQIGRKLSLSKERVRQIELQALKKIRAVTNLDETGISA